MAKKADSSPKKKKPVKADAGITIKVKAKTDGKKGKKDGKKHKHEGFEKLSQLAEHPLVGDLLAVGAMAAVAAIAEAGIAKKSGAQAAKSANTQAVKAAGKAAAAAIGQRLINEFGASLKKDQAK